MNILNFDNGIYHSNYFTHTFLMVNNLGAFAETLCSVGAFNSVK